MPLINTSVPNLIQGVSQQPDASRFAGQCDEQENALNSVAEGLKKRPNTKHITQLLTTAIDEDSFVKFINRSATEKYVVIIHKLLDGNDNHVGCKIRAFNLIDGTEATIRVGDVAYNASFLSMVNPDSETGANYTQTDINDDATLSNTSYTLGGNNYPYLNAENPQKDLEGLSIGDSTFLLNKTKVVAPTTRRTPEFDREGLVFVSQGAYNKRYQVNIDVTADEELIPTGITAPELSITIESYAVGAGQAFYSGWIYPLEWRIKSVDISNAGSGLTVAPTVSVTANSTIYNQPDIQLTIDTEVDAQGDPVNANTYGKVIAATLGTDSTARGRFQGVQTDTTDLTGQALTFANLYNSYGITQPTVTAVISGFQPSILDSYMGHEDTPAGTGTTPATGKLVANSERICTDLRVDLQANNSNTTTSNVPISRYFHVGAHTQPNDGSSFFMRIKNTVTDADDNDLGNVDFTLSTTDSLSDTGLIGIYKETDSISSLPYNNKNGFTVKVKGDPELASDDFYVKFETANNQAFGSGSYVETVGNNIVAGYDNSTMPHQLVNDGVNTFTLQRASYADRVAGDDDTNPLPSFVGSSIDNMFFFKNRLGFLSKENIIMSESGFGGVNSNGQTVFNFGRTTVTTLLDSDPIDVSVATSRVTNLKSARSFQENLIVFSENGQFALKGGDVLTPKTVSITPITNFSFEAQVDPLPLGSYVYFPFTRGNFTGMREFTVNATTDNYDSTEVTEHVPAYIPKDIIGMTGTTSEDMIVLLSEQERGSLYIYSYFWNNNQKILSAWSKFTFSGKIHGIQFVESTLYMVTTDDQSNTHLVALSMETDAAEVDHNGDTAPFRTLLDRRVRAKMTSGSDLIEFEQADGSYSSANADLPYTYFNGNLTGSETLDEVFVDSTGVTHTLKPMNSNGVRVHLTGGNASSTLYGYVGLPYTMKYRFSTQVFKAQSGNSASPTNASEMQVRNGTMFFDDTHTFDVKVTPEHRSTATSTFSANDRPEADQLGAIKFAEGNFRFPVYSKAKHADILIENSSPFDSKFSSAEFESFVHPRSRRYG